MYALYENAVMMLLGYVLAPIENGKRMSDEWELHINYNPSHKSIKLNEEHFSSSTVSPKLIAEIGAIDPGWIVDSG